MLKEKLLPVSILCLSVSLIISAFIISNGMKHNGENVGSGLSTISQGLNNVSNSLYNSNNYNLTANRNNMDLMTAADYLGIPNTKLKQLVDSVGFGIPHIKVGDQYIFNKSALDKWMETAKIEMK